MTSVFSEAQPALTSKACHGAGAHTRPKAMSPPRGSQKAAPRLKPAAPAWSRLQLPRPEAPRHTQHTGSPQGSPAAHLLYGVEADATHRALPRAGAARAGLASSIPAPLLLPAALPSGSPHGTQVPLQTEPIPPSGAAGIWPSPAPADGQEHRAWQWHPRPA